METSPVQLKKVAEWAKWWAEILPPLNTKEKETYLKKLTKSKCPPYLF